MKIIRRSNKMLQARPEGDWQMRVYHRKGIRKQEPRHLIKCGCCDEKVEIYYGSGTLEINGALGSVEDWREILIPLLERSQ